MANKPTTFQDATRPQPNVVEDQSKQRPSVPFQIPVVSHDTCTPHSMSVPGKERRYTNMMMYPDMSQSAREVSTTLAAQSGCGMYTLERTGTFAAELLPYFM